MNCPPTAYLLLRPVLTQAARGRAQAQNDP